MSFLKRRGKSSKKAPSGVEAIEEGYEVLEQYQGNYKHGKRHGLGVYHYPNGDIYDGQWRKGRKEGYGIYMFADGNKSVGWFYENEYVGKEPNEKLRQKMRKTERSSCDDAKPLRMDNQETRDSEDESQSDDENGGNLGLCQDFNDNCKKIRKKFEGQ